MVRQRYRNKAKYRKEKRGIGNGTEKIGTHKEVIMIKNVIRVKEIRYSSFYVYTKLKTSNYIIRAGRERKDDDSALKAIQKKEQIITRHKIFLKLFHIDVWKWKKLGKRKITKSLCKIITNKNDKIQRK